MRKPSIILLAAVAGITLASYGQAQYSTPVELIRAVEEGNVSKVRELMKECRCPNTRTTDGDPALVVAARNGSMQLARFLLESGANPNMASRESEVTALMEFAQQDQVAGVDLLLKNGAKIDAADSAGDTALMYAVSARAHRVVQLLTAKGADPRLANYQGQTALDLARSRRYRRIETLLRDAAG